MSRYTPALIVAALIGLVFAPLLLHPGYLLYPRSGQATDLTITHWPAVAFNVRTWRQEGQIPLWRTTIASGGPWAANPQSWLFYPPAWLFFLLPINLTFNLLLLGHLLLAALGTYAFGRRAMGLARPGAVLAGLAFALAPWLSAQLAAGHVNVALALSWLPVAMLGAQRAATGDRPGGALLTGVAWAAALLNHAQMAAFSAALSLAWYFFAWRRTARQGASHRAARLARLAAMPAVALLLSAALLVPLAEALPYLNRANLSLSEAGIFSLSWPQLLTAVIPTYGGEPEQAIYLGLPLVLLAAAGLLRRRDGASWFFVGAAAVAVLFGLGSHGPLFPILFRLVPGVDWLRVPPRAWVLVAFSLALLAGRGLDATMAPRLDAAARRRLLRLAAVALVAGLTLAGGLAFLFRPLPPAAASLAALAVLASAALILRARQRIAPRTFALVVVALTVADLGLVRGAWTEMRPPDQAFAWHAEVAEFLAAQPGPFRVYSPSYSLPQHVALQRGLALADGVDPFQLAAYANFLAQAGGYEANGYSPSLPPRLDDADAQPDATRLGLLNVGYVASDLGLQVPGLEEVARFGETHVYRNGEVLPRAFVVKQPQGSGEPDLTRPVEAAVAHVARYTPNRIVVEANLAAPGLLVLSEVWYPGWRALADGGPVAIQRVAGVLRGVPLPAGAHSVEFRYSPWTVWTGLGVSGATALLLLAYAARHAWRRR